MWLFWCYILPSKYDLTNHFSGLESSVARGTIHPLLGKQEGSLPLTPRTKLSNQKGSVGKTTTVVNISVVLLHVGKGVLFIDMELLTFLLSAHLYRMFSFSRENRYAFSFSLKPPTSHSIKNPSFLNTNPFLYTQSNLYIYRRM
jgi:AAA domain